MTQEKHQQKNQQLGKLLRQHCLVLVLELELELGSNDDDDGDDGLHEPTLHSLRQQRKEQHKGSSPFPLRQECVKDKNLPNKCEDYITNNSPLVFGGCWSMRVGIEGNFIGDNWDFFFGRKKGADFKFPFLNILFW